MSTPPAPRRTLVTGGAGFIGSHLAEALIARGDEVLVLDDESTGNRQNLAAIAGSPRLRFVAGSAADASLLRDLLPGVSQVYHLAAAVGVALVAREPVDSVLRNIHPLAALLPELAARRAAGEDVRLFLASSSEVYGKNPRPQWTENEDLVFGPTTRSRWSYGAAKAIDEFLALGSFRQSGLSVVIGRFFNVVGPRQSGAYGMVLPRFLAAARAKEPLVVHDDGQQVRCFAHVRDVVAGVLALMDAPAAIGRVVNIGSDQPVSILELARRVIALSGSTSPIVHLPYAEAYDADFEDVRRRVPDLARLRSLIPWQPRFDLDAIIRDCLAAERPDLPAPWASMSQT